MMHLPAWNALVSGSSPATDAAHLTSGVPTAKADAEIRCRSANSLATQVATFHTLVIGVISHFPDSHLSTGLPVEALRSATPTDVLLGDLHARLTKPNGTNAGTICPARAQSDRLRSRTGEITAMPVTETMLSRRKWTFHPLMPT
jgi:hypothetical protein